MDSLKPRKKMVSAGDGMVVRRQAPPPAPVTAQAPVAKPHIDHRPKSESSKSGEPAFSQAERLSLRGKHRGSSPWRRMLTLACSSLVVLLFIGFLYSRAVLEIIPESEHKTIVRTFNVTKQITSGAVHAIWLEASSFDSVLSDKSLYPTYIPLAANKSTGSVIVVSRAQLVDMIASDLKLDSEGYKSEIVDITVSKPVFDSYVFISKPDSFTVDAEINVYTRSLLDPKRIALECHYKTILPNTQELSRCLESTKGIAGARLIIHPWFAVRTPIARAIEVQILK